MTGILMTAQFVAMHFYIRPNYKRRNSERIKFQEQLNNDDKKCFIVNIICIKEECQSK